MPFTPRVWLDKYILRAADLIDLETRVTDYTDAAVAGGSDALTGAFYASQYGVVGDGTTPCAALLQDCIDDAKAASAGVVFLPAAPAGSPIMLESQIWVPDGIRLVGTGRRGTTLKAINGTFPINTPVIRLGNPNILPTPPNDVAFDARLENLSINADKITGGVCVQMHGCQEGAGLEHVGCYDWNVSAIVIQSSQNSRLYDLELYGNFSTVISSIAIDVQNGGPFTIEWVTANCANAAGPSYGIKLNGCLQVVLRQIHIEQCYYGVWSNSGSTHVIGLNGSGSTDTLMYFDPSNNTGSCIGLAANGSRVLLQDDWAGYTALSSTSNDIAMYVQRELYLGVGLTAPASVPAGFFQGTLKTYRSTTANRQSASSRGAGAQAFDSTLGIPIWSDGTNWRNAAGSVV